MKLRILWLLFVITIVAGCSRERPAASGKATAVERLPPEVIGDPASVQPKVSPGRG